MNPYTNFLYFGVSLYVLIPSLLLGWIKRLSKALIVAGTAVMLVIQYWSAQNLSPSTAIQGIWLVLGYALLQWINALVFLAVQKRSGSRAAFYSALLIGLLPLLSARFIPLFQPSYSLFFLGLSYVTFRALDTILAIRDGLIQSVPPVQYLTFLLFFPTISSGPVDRYQRFADDWQHQRSGADFLKDLDGAVQRIFTGFLYKFILASLIKQYWLDPAAHGMGFLPLVSYMYAYSLYLFFDFAGYSAFAIGFSYLFGIHTPENFDRPFLARNIRDFWNRWHISLSWWFRDQIYNRFVFAALKGRWFRNKYVASYLGFLLTMGLMGLWHGTAWHFLLYGLYHGVLLILTDLFLRWNKRQQWVNSQRFLWKAAGVLLTIQLVCFGLLIFSGRLG